MQHQGWGGRAGCPTRPTARSPGLGCRHLPAAQQIPRPSGRWGKDPSPPARAVLRGRARTCSVAPWPGQAPPGSVHPQKRRPPAHGCRRIHPPPGLGGGGLAEAAPTTATAPGGGPTAAPGTRGDPDGTPETAPLQPRGPEGTPEVTPPRPRAGLRGEGEPSRSDSSPHADAGGFSPPSPGRSRGYGLPAPPAGRVPRAGTRGRGHGAGIQPRAGALRRGSRSSPAPQLQKPRAAQGPSAQHPTRSR